MYSDAKSPEAADVSALLPVSELLSKATGSYSTVLDQLDHDSSPGNIQTVLRFHYLKLDPVTGEPMVSELVELLYNQLAEFCLKARRVESAKHSHEHLALHGEARRLLRKYKVAGEAGEILIYFLIEAILGAPQMVAKIDLKTNSKMESLGADGLHFKWNQEDRVLDIYCAESKLEQQASKGVEHLVESLEKFHGSKDYKHEIRLATAHFKHADKEMKEAVLRVLQNKESGVIYRLRHACLVGYNWNGYTGLAGTDLRVREAEFRARYEKQKKRLHQLINTHFHRAVKAAGTLVAFDVFFLPFSSIQDFREKFLAAVE